MRVVPPPWVAPGNDYRGITALDPGSPPSIAVIVIGASCDGTPEEPGDLSYEGVSRVITAAPEDVAAATEEFDVLVFLQDGDVPGPGWLDAHARWHRRAGNIVVIGPTADAAGSRVVRGTRLLVGNDEGFAAVISKNVSLPRWAWLAHPGLDIVAGWHHWNAGMFFAFEPDAILIGEGGDSGAAPPGPLELEDAIPHRAYRRFPAAFHSTPKVSWLIGAGTADEARAAWQLCQQSTFSDQEVVVFGPDAAVADFAPVAALNPRLAVVGGEGGFAEAVTVSRGEVIAILDARAVISPETVAKAISRFEAKPSAPVVRVGYDVGGARYLRLDDLAAVDLALGRHGLPLFAVVTRRELMKDHAALADPGSAWADTLDRCDTSLVMSPLVAIPGTAPIAARTPGLGEVTSIGIREAAREVVKQARRRRAAVASPTGQDIVATTDHDTGGRVSVAYVGLTGHDNLGDEAVRVAIERLMPWADFDPDPIDPQLLMIGGGTLINGRRYYLNRMLRQESSVVERALFGTGVRSPEYWGVTEPMEDWFTFIDSALFAAVRGPDSVKNLRALGYGKDLPIIGDPALYLQAPEGSQRVEGRVVVCPLYTNGNLHGGNDMVVFDALAGLIERLLSEGREVVMMSAFPQDDRWVIEIMRRASAPDLPYVAGYADIDLTMGLLASADVVVGERLHAAIMAAAAGVPFVGLEYRPKMRDFARSVGQEHAVIRTDEMDRLEGVFDQVVAGREGVLAELGRRVTEYRALQADAAEQLRRRLLGT